MQTETVIFLSKTPGWRWLSINRPTKRRKEKSPSDGRCQCEKELEDHLLECQLLLMSEHHILWKSMTFHFLQRLTAIIVILLRKRECCFYGYGSVWYINENILIWLELNHFLILKKNRFSMRNTTVPEQGREYNIDVYCIHALARRACGRCVRRAIGEVKQGLQKLIIEWVTTNSLSQVPRASEGTLSHPSCSCS
jgi:hypothetical protein